MHKKSPPRPNEEDPSATNTGPSGKHSLNSADYPTALLNSKAADVASRLAQAGYVVHDVADGYVIIRADWGLSRHCETLADLQDFARKVGVSQ